MDPEPYVEHIADVPADAEHRVVSVRQIVARNLSRARKARGLTQDELGERLTELTGTPWSRATVSAAETGWEGSSGRVRHFDVDELVALAIALSLPVSWFLMPPPEGPRLAVDEDGVDWSPWITVDKNGAGSRRSFTSALLNELVLTLDDDSDPDHLMVKRIEAEAPGQIQGKRIESAVLRAAQEHLSDAQALVARLLEPDSDPFPSAVDASGRDQSGSGG